jgi:hypothetical protein
LQCILSICFLFGGKDSANRAKKKQFCLKVLASKWCGDKYLVFVYMSFDIIFVPFLDNPEKVVTLHLISLAP